MTRLASSRATPRASTSQSLREKGRCTYQVRFFFLPKPRSSMALLMVSMRARLERMRGKRMFTEFFSRALSFSLLPSSTPRACWAWLMLW